MLGAIGVVQLAHEVDVPAATATALEQGVWLRPFRDLIYTMPPYVCSDEDVQTIAARLSRPPPVSPADPFVLVTAHVAAA